MSSTTRRNGRESGTGQDTPLRCVSMSRPASRYALPDMA